MLNRLLNRDSMPALCQIRGIPSVRWWRNRAGWWDPFAVANVLTSALCVFRWRQTFRLTGAAFGCFGEIAFYVRDAPAATGSRAAAFADLADATRFVNADEIHNLAFGHVKAVADCIVRFHGRLAVSELEKPAFRTNTFEALEI